MKPVLKIALCGLFGLLGTVWNGQQVAAASLCSAKCVFKYEDGLAREGCYARCAAEEAARDGLEAADEAYEAGKESAKEAYEVGKETAEDAMKFIEGFIGGAESQREQELAPLVEPESGGGNGLSL